MSADERRTLEVGRIIKAHGLKGQVVVDLWTDRTERLAPGTQLSTPQGPLSVKSAAAHQDRFLVWFHEINSREDTEAWRGVVLSAPQLEVHDEDVIWIDDLFGARVVDAIVAGRSPAEGPERTGVLAEHASIPLRQLEGCRCAGTGAGTGWVSASEPAETTGSAPETSPPAATVAERRAALQAALTANAGVVRDAASLAGAGKVVRDLADGLPPVESWTAADAELSNLVVLARALVEAATAREESRGAHTRSDFPATSADFRVRLVHGRRP